MNRNVFRDDAADDDVLRMNAFWGDQSWRTAAFSDKYHLFQEMEKQPNEAVVEAFSDRLKKDGGFKFVPPPLAMKNSIEGTFLWTGVRSPARS